MANSGRWRKESKEFLLRNPYCVYCADRGRQTLAEVVDHYIAHKGNAGLFWDQNNWRASCHSCNSAKCAREEGGFGNPRKG